VSVKQLESDSPDPVTDENRKHHILLADPQPRMFLDRLAVARTNGFEEAYAANPHHQSLTQATGSCHGPASLRLSLLAPARPARTRAARVDERRGRARRARRRGGSRRRPAPAPRRRWRRTPRPAPRDG